MSAAPHNLAKIAVCTSPEKSLSCTTHSAPVVHSLFSSEKVLTLLQRCPMMIQTSTNPQLAASSVREFDLRLWDVVARHLRHLELFLSAAADRRIQFKLTKCKWLQKQIQLLGFVLGNGEKRVDPKKAQALRDWPDPSSLEDVMSMRAFANFGQKSDT